MSPRRRRPASRTRRRWRGRATIRALLAGCRAWGAPPTAPAPYLAAIPPMTARHAPRGWHHPVMLRTLAHHMARRVEHAQVQKLPQGRRERVIDFAGCRVANQNRGHRAGAFPRLHELYRPELPRQVNRAQDEENGK